MQGFKNISNSELLLKTKTLVQEERRIATEVLWCLQEVESRLIYAELGYSSLYDFAIRELGYSEGSAHRRISAMRLLKALPVATQKQTEEKMKTGSVSLTNLALLQSFFKTEKKIHHKDYSDDQKQDLIGRLENQTKREAEKILIQLQPEFEKKERERVVGATEVQITFVASEQLMAKLRKIKNLTGHQDQSPTYAQLIEKMADVMLAKIDPLVQKSRSISLAQSSTKVSVTSSAGPKGIAHEKSETAIARTAEIKNSTKDKNTLTRHIPAAVRRKVWLRDRARCTYVHRETQKKCESQFGLELDHIRPFSMDGSHELENLRLRCRAHNQLHAQRCEIRKKS